MSRLDEDITKLKQKHAEELAHMIRENTIREKLEPIASGYELARIHFFRLYGAVGSIHFKGTEYDSLRRPGEKAPDPELLRRLLASYPPVPAVRVKDACTSFRPDIPANNPEGANLYDCHGVIVDVETFQSQTAGVEWHAELDGELWRFGVSVPWYQTDFGTLSLRSKRYGGDGPVASWECSLQPKHNAQVIRWASGAAQYPNRFTLYWDRHSGAALDFPALIAGKVAHV